MFEKNKFLELFTNFITSNCFLGITFSKCVHSDYNKTLCTFTYKLYLNRTVALVQKLSTQVNRISYSLSYACVKQFVSSPPMGTPEFWNVRSNISSHGSDTMRSFQLNQQPT